MSGHLGLDYEPIPTYICLSSDCSADMYPNNSRTSFVNKLPTPIRVNGADQLYIRLHSIDFAEGPISEYLKVHIDEVTEQVQGRIYSKYTGGFTIPSQQRLSNEYGRSYFLNSPFLPLKTQDLQQIGIQILNAENWPITLPDSPPTLLMVEIGVNKSVDQFLVTCHSRHPDLYPNNSLGQFISPLPTEICADGYEVALVNVVYPGLMEEGHNMVTIYVDDAAASSDIKGKEYTIDFIREIQDQIREVSNGLTSFGIVPDGHEKGRIFIKNSEENENSVTITCNHKFAKVCGDLSGKNIQQVLQPGEQYLFRGYPNMYWLASSPSAILTCSVVETGVSFGQRQKVLQCVPVYKSEDDDENRLYQPPQLIFIPAVKYPFRSIEFHFLEPDGRMKNFVPDNREEDDLYITLLFRRKKIDHVLPMEI